MKIAIAVDNAFERDNFEFSSLVSCDEELARILQNQELAADDYLVIKI